MLMVMAEDQEGGYSGSMILGAKVGSGGRSQAALWYRITELQQKDVLLTEGGLTLRNTGYRYTAMGSPYNFQPTTVSN